MRDGGLPAWAAWSARAAADPWTVGIEDEAMLLEPVTWAPANRIEDVLAALAPELAQCVSAETHACVAELRTAPHATVAGAAAELTALRRALADTVDDALGLRVAAAGTHPLAQPGQVSICTRSHYRAVTEMTRGLAHREPTMGQHVHVAVADPTAAVRALDGLRGELPLLLALSANSPYWHGVDSGFASARTPLFSAFPRSGIARAFGGYGAYVAAVEPLLRGGAIPGPGFLWWDARLQPRLGTVEVRIMDAQSRPADVAALAAVVQCLVRVAADGAAPAPAPEVLDENRFLAARDGMDARLLDARGRRIAAQDAVLELLVRCAPAALELGCTQELGQAVRLAADPGDARQRRAAAQGGLEALPGRLAEAYAPLPVGLAGRV
jgi:glutamate---cysteine ligase / carboxylate-amine ligase